MGYERLVSVLQDKPSNYDTDCFTPIFGMPLSSHFCADIGAEKIKEVTGAREYRGGFGEQDADGIDTAYRVVADHLRLLTFAIADGGIPNNVGRGYVVRRVLRRGARYARRYFNVELGGFFSSLVPTLVEDLSHVFPEIKSKQADIQEILDEEELSFAKSLDRGEVIFDRLAKEAVTRGDRKLRGTDVWRLYDTYGFPLDLTKIMAEEQNLTIDEKEVAEAQERARLASMAQKKAGVVQVKLGVHDLGALEKMDDVPKTEDSFKFGRENVSAKVKAVFKDGKFLKDTKEVPEGEQFGLLLDKTNFYAEQGGQIYDTGSLVIDGVAEFSVEDCQMYGGYVLHTGAMKYGSFSVGTEVLCVYDEVSGNLRWAS
jgi:alanyl-tRNA synthetase